MIIWKTEKRIVKDLKFFEANPRKISEEAFEKLKESIRTTGYAELVAIDKDNTIVAGHMRVRALIALGRENEEIDVRVPEKKLTQKEFDRYLLASNKSTGEWDFEVLANFDENMLSDVGFSSKEMDKMFGLDEDTEEDDFDADEAVKNIKEPTSALGNIYQLGSHRLMCGDATKLEDIEKLMGGVQADLIITDPPYNVAYKGKTKDKLTIENDSMGDGDFLQFLTDAFVGLYSVAKDGCPIYVFHADSEGYNFRAAFRDSGFTLKQTCIWLKNHMVLGRQDYQWKHEPILYGWKEGAAHPWFADRSETTVWEFKKPNRSGEHPTMKPIDLISYPMRNSSERGGVVLDVFGGSGSTLIAAQKLGRVCYMLEFDPKYTDVIIARWEKETGEKAVKLN